MAKRYQKVLVTTWMGETVRDASDAARVLFLYLLTGPETTLLTGIVPASIGTIAHRLRWSEDKVRATMAELVADGSVVHDEDAGVTWLSNAIEHNPPINPSIVRSWEGKWNEVPKCPLKVAAYQVLRSWCAEKGAPWLAAFDAGCKAPKLSARGPSSPQKPAAAHNAGHDAGHHGHHHDGHHDGHGVPHQYQEQYQEQKTLPPTPPGGGMRGRACESAHEDAPATSPSARVLATVVSEVPPSRTPPAPVEVAPSLPTAPSAPPSAATGASSAPDAEDDDQPPPAQRVPSTPRPEPVAVAAPAPAPAPVAPPAAARPSAPVAAAPTLPLDLPTPPAPPLAKGRRTRATPEAVEADVLAVFEHWRETVWKSRAVLNDARRTRIASRLAEGFTVADLKRAADGATRDDWLMGRAEGVRAGGHRDVETVYRDAAQVERLMQLAPKAPPAPPSPVVRLPPPLPPHLAARAARPVPSLADFLAHGMQAPPAPRPTAAQIDAALAAQENSHAC